jgi:hypothetical protein
MKPTVIWAAVMTILMVIRLVIGNWAAAILSPVLIWAGISIGSDKKSKRKLSFMSEALAKGVFPPEAKIPEPVMNGIMWMEKLPEKSKMVEEFAQVLQKSAYRRFKSLLVEDNGNVSFKEIPFEEFDLNGRFIEHSVQSEQEAVNAMESNMLREMETGKPLWEYHLFRNQGNGRSVIMAKVHHAIGDGISMVSFISKMFRNADGSQFSFADSKVVGKDNKAKIDYKKMAMGLLGSLAKVLALPNSKFDSPTRLKDVRTPHVYSGNRKLLIGKPIDLAMIKDIKNATKTTVNDVCTAALAGSIRRYLDEQKDQTLNSKDFQFRACLPYGFPRQTDPDKVYDALRNWWVLVSLHLPVQIPVDKPLDRLTEAKAVCDKMKSSPEALVQYYLQVFASKVLPYSVQRQTNLGTILRHSMVYTNLPGPDATVLFCGEPIVQFDIAVMNCLPQMSMFSYNGKLSVTWVIDDQVTPHANKLLDYFYDELKALHNAVKKN